jgi:hypothetical protein
MNKDSYNASKRDWKLSLLPCQCGTWNNNQVIVNGTNIDFGGFKFPQDAVILKKIEIIKTVQDELCKMHQDEDTLCDNHIRWFAMLQG